MNLYALFLFSITLLLVTVQLQFEPLQDLSRSFVIIIVIFASFKYWKYFLYPKYLLSLFSSLVVVALLSFSFNALLGVYSAFLVYFSLINRSNSPPFLLFIFLQSNSFPAKIVELRIKNILLNIIFFIFTFILFWYFPSE